MYYLTYYKQWWKNVTKNTQWINHTPLHWLLDIYVCIIFSVFCWSAVQTSSWSVCVFQPFYYTINIQLVVVDVFREFLTIEARVHFQVFHIMFAGQKWHWHRVFCECIGFLCQASFCEWCTFICPALRCAIVVLPASPLLQVWFWGGSWPVAQGKIV